MSEVDLEPARVHPYNTRLRRRQVVMNPDTQIILDEIARRFTDHEVQLDRRLAEQVTRWESTFTEFATDQQQRVRSLEKASSVFDEWRTSMEGTVDDLRLEVGKIAKHWERAVVDKSTTMIGVLAPAPHAAERPSAGSTATSPHGHRVDVHHQEDGFGSVTTLIHPPVKGTCSHLPSGSVPLADELRVHALGQPVGTLPGVEAMLPASTTDLGRLPKLNFPVFDGDNPKLWIRCSHDYFELYAVERPVWVKVSTMHFVGSAARWLSSLDDQFHSFPWAWFCSQLMERFGKDEHEVFIRRLFRISQTATVKEYVDQFSALVDNLVSYGRHVDPLYFVQRFVDGLRDDIRAAVIVQRPSSLDTACVLALLQEEVTTPTKHLDARRPDVAWVARPPLKGPLPLPLPPRGDRPMMPDDAGRRTEQQRPRVMDDKVAALRAYRRARGLCHRCAEKWSPDHRCPQAIQLHAMQELWDLCQLEDEDSTPVLTTETVTEEQLFLAVSVAAAKGVNSVNTMKFKGVIQGVEVLILVDSGSSHSFLSATVASQLTGLSSLSPPVLVQVADGGRIRCSQQLLNAAWSVQQCDFLTDFRILDLSSYDMIVGMDWLAMHSPMRIHWLQNWMVISYHNSSALLHGLSAVLLPGSVVEVTVVDQVIPSFEELPLPPLLVSLLTEFAEIFAPPVGLPPSRSCDHTIPLVPGATPVHIRPYRYPPAMKDEIERQVTAMLQSGLIQPSTSQFSSSVLLVKKKDNTWRFCVDFLGI